MSLFVKINLHEGGMDIFFYFDRKLVCVYCTD